MWLRASSGGGILLHLTPACCRSQTQPLCDRLTGRQRERRGCSEEGKAIRCRTAAVERMLPRPRPQVGKCLSLIAHVCLDAFLVVWLRLCWRRQNHPGSRLSLATRQSPLRGQHLTGQKVPGSTGSLAQTRGVHTAKFAALRRKRTGYLLPNAVRAEIPLRQAGILLKSDVSQRTRAWEIKGGARCDSRRGHHQNPGSQTGCAPCLVVC